MTRAGPDFLAVARIGRAHGVRGELEVDVWTDFPERFRPGSALYVGLPDAPAPRLVTIVGARPHRDRLLVRLDCTPDRTAAESLVGLVLFVPTSEAMPLAEDTYYHHQLVGLAAELPDGTPLGTVTEVIETGSADVLVVSGARGEVLLPMTASVIAAIDLVAGRVTVTPLPGLLDD